MSTHPMLCPACGFDMDLAPRHECTPPEPLVKPIQWGEEEGLTSACPYNHVVGQSPLGPFIVSLVSWGDRLAYDLYASPLAGVGRGVLDAVDLDEALEEVQRLYDRHLKSCLNL